MSFSLRILSRSQSFGNRLALNLQSISQNKSFSYIWVKRRLKYNTYSLDITKNRSYCFHQLLVTLKHIFKVFFKLILIKLFFKQMSGFEVNRFVDLSERESQHLICGICRNVFNNAIRSDCEHTFCRQCVEDWIKTKQK